ncbi:hypothetical protein [Mangrovibacter phragmitis]|uniref:hypothetical protein n=1 Tax=Mangrovibacter phragmitis TaxID=1691903 RepID=UPI0012E93943|nr:hypothetical protein [Mangrovibacter phragmitis]
MRRRLPILPGGPGLQSSAGLVSARGMLPEQAQRATHEIGRQWVLNRQNQLYYWQ